MGNEQSSNSKHFRVVLFRELDNLDSLYRLDQPPLVVQDHSVNAKLNHSSLPGQSPIRSLSSLPLRSIVLGGHLVVGHMPSLRRPYTSRPANTMLARSLTRSSWKEGNIWFCLDLALKIQHQLILGSERNRSFEKDFQRKSPHRHSARLL